MDRLTDPHPSAGVVQKCCFVLQNRMAVFFIIVYYSFIIVFLFKFTAPSNVEHWEAAAFTG